MSLLNKFFGYCKSEITERMPWVLLAYIIGILMSFIYKVNPFVVVGLLIICGVVFFKLRARLIVSWMALIVFCFSFGLGNMGLHLYLTHHFSIQHPIYQTRITATVLENQPLMDKQILILSDIRW